MKSLVFVLTFLLIIFCGAKKENKKGKRGEILSTKAESTLILSKSLKEISSIILSPF